MPTSVTTATTVDGPLIDYAGETIDASWSDTLDNGDYRLQARGEGGTWPTVTWRGSHALEFAAGDDVSFDPITISASSGAVAIRFKTDADYSDNYSNRAPLIGGASGGGKWTSNLALRDGDGSGEYGIVGEVNNNDGFYVYGNDGVARGEFHTIIVNFEDGTATTYVDTDQYDSRAAPNDLTVSQIAGATDSEYAGIVYGFAHWNRPLEQHEIEDVDEGLIPTDGLLNHIPCDDGSGSTARDRYGSSDGTVNGATWIAHESEHHVVLDETVTSYTLTNIIHGIDHEVRLRGESYTTNGEWQTVTQFFREADSHSRVIDSLGTRTISVVRSPSPSHVDGVHSWAYNDKASLEILDFDIMWDEEGHFWYTDWFDEHRVLGDEDAMSIIPFVTPDSKDPCARVFVQYDADGDGEPEETSDPIHVTDSEKAQRVTGITLEDGGSYRLKITRYSGYNSIYTLNIGFTH